MNICISSPYAQIYDEYLGYFSQLPDIPTMDIEISGPSVQIYDEYLSNFSELPDILLVQNQQSDNTLFKSGTSIA